MKILKNQQKDDVEGSMEKECDVNVSTETAPKSRL